MAGANRLSQATAAAAIPQHPSPRWLGLPQRAFGKQLQHVQDLIRLPRVSNAEVVVLADRDVQGLW